MRLEREYWRSLPRHTRFPCPPRNAEGRDYEFMRVVYWPNTDDPRAGRRYVGCHAEILEERGTLARVRVRPPGASHDDTAPASTMWLDLSSPDQCDVGPGSLTRSGVGENAPKEGALFLPIGFTTPRGRRRGRLPRRW